MVCYCSFLAPRVAPEIFLAIIAFSKHAADTNPFVFETDAVCCDTLHGQLAMTGSTCTAEAHLSGPSSDHSTDGKAASCVASDLTGRSTLLTTIGEPAPPSAEADFTADYTGNGSIE